MNTRVVCLVAEEYSVLVLQYNFNHDCFSICAEVTCSLTVYHVSCCEGYALQCIHFCKSFDFGVMVQACWNLS